MNCAVCGDELAPNGNYLYQHDGKVSHYYCDLVRQNREYLNEIIELKAENLTLDANLTACEVRCIDLEKENIRLRDLLDKKLGTSIRIELPEQANGYRCYVTCQREKDEERMAEILAESIKMLCEVANNYQKKPKTEQTEVKKPFAQFFVNQGQTFRSHDYYGLEYTNYHDFPVKVTVEAIKPKKECDLQTELERNDQ